MANQMTVDRVTVQKVPFKVKRFTLKVNTDEWCPNDLGKEVEVTLRGRIMKMDVNHDRKYWTGQDHVEVEVVG